MQNDSIQMRTAVQMFIDFLLEHREELEKVIEELREEAEKVQEEESVDENAKDD